jgi:hypothetical protein
VLCLFVFSNAYSSSSELDKKEIDLLQIRDYALSNPQVAGVLRVYTRACACMPLALGFAQKMVVAWLGPGVALWPGSALALLYLF